MLTQEYVNSRFTLRGSELFWKYQPDKSDGWNNRYMEQRAGSKRKDKRIVVRLDGKLYLAHTLIFLMVNGYIPKEIDHEDRDPSNNDPVNLVDKTRSGNNRNTNAKGVVEVAGRFIARIYADGKQIHLGSYGTFEEAREAYLSAKAVYHEVYIV